MIRIIYNLRWSIPILGGERSLAKSGRVPGHSLSRVTLSVKASDPPPRRMRIATKVTTVGVVVDGLVLLPSK